MPKFNDNLKKKYLIALSESDTPLLIIDKLGISYQQLKTARQDEEFKESERLANEMYQERFYELIKEKIKDNPNLLLKFGEKIVNKLKEDKTVNINTGDNTVNILGITNEQGYADTQALLKSIQGNKSLPGKDG